MKTGRDPFQGWEEVLDRFSWGNVRGKATGDADLEAGRLFCNAGLGR